MRHIACVQVDWSHLHVMGGGMVLGKIVCKVKFAFGPYDNEVALVDTIRYPVEAHVHCLGPFEFGALCGKAMGGGIFSNDLCGLQLLAPKFFEYLPEEHRLLSIVEKGSNFGFQRYRNHMFEDASFDVDRAIGAINFGGLIAPA